VLEFAGHGAFGFFQKPSFAGYFGVVGLADHAPLLRPLIGVHDELIALVALVAPVRAVLVWAAAWGAWTALLRPLAGEPWWECLERSYNVGGPLALLLLARTPSWWSRVREWHTAATAPPAFAVTLRLTVAAMMLGHGGLMALTRKPVFAEQWVALGVPAATAPVLGTIEIGLGAMALARPMGPLMLGIAAWKLATEALAPLTGIPAFHPWFEWIEHGAAYACPAALAWWAAMSKRARKTHVP
jgi:hypothetical protein